MHTHTHTPCCFPDPIYLGCGCPHRFGRFPDDSTGSASISSEFAGVPFLVTELLERGSLRNVLVSSPKIALETKLGFALDAASGYVEGRKPSLLFCPFLLD